MVFTRDGASVLDTWPLDGWGNTHSLTHPSQLDDRGRPRLLLGDNAESRQLASLGPGRRGVIYRIMDENSDEVIDIGETNQTIEARQRGRFGEHRWMEHARVHPTCIQVLVPVNGRINRLDGEAVHLRNYVNIHGHLPKFNVIPERPPLRVSQWVSGIRKLARDFADDDNIGIRNISRGKGEEPNEAWQKMFPKVSEIEGVTEDLQVLIDAGRRQIMGFSGKCCYMFLRPRARFKWRLQLRVPNSALYVRESGKIGYWDASEDEAEDFYLDNLYDEDIDFLKRVVDYSLRTYWA